MKLHAKWLISARLKGTLWTWWNYNNIIDRMSKRAFALLFSCHCIWAIKSSCGKSPTSRGSRWSWFGFMWSKICCSPFAPPNYIAKLFKGQEPRLDSLERNTTDTPKGRAEETSQSGSNKATSKCLISAIIFRISDSMRSNNLFSESRLCTSNHGKIKVATARKSNRILFK